MMIVKDKPARMGDATAQAAQTLVDYLAGSSRAALKTLPVALTTNSSEAPLAGAKPRRRLFSAYEPISEPAMLFPSSRLFGGLGAVAKPKQHARLGQLYSNTYAETFASVAGLIANMQATGSDLYSIFVAYCLKEKLPSTPWAADAYQVNEALKVFSANYAATQSSTEAAAWGVRFPLDMRADIAFKRLTLASAQWDELFTGWYTPLTGHLTTDQATADAQNLIGQMGARPTFFYTPGHSVYLVGWESPSITTPQTLTNGPDGTKGSLNLELWYSHVYRALGAFVAGAMTYYYNTGRNPADVYRELDIPNVDSLQFNLWVVAGNTFWFDRFGGNQALRDATSNGFLNEIKAGFNLAAVQGTAEVNLGQLIGASIKSQIDFLTYIQYILKILALPVTLGANLLTGGAFPDLLPPIPWYVWAGLTFLGGVGIYAALK